MCESTKLTVSVFGVNIPPLTVSLFGVQFPTVTVYFYNGLFLPCGKYTARVVLRMAQIIDPAKNQLLHKASAAINISTRLKFTERKALNTLLWNAQENRFQRSAESDMPLDLFMSMIGWNNSKNVTEAKEILEKLTETKVTWNSEGTDKTAEWGVCTFLQGARIKGNKVSYRINTYLEEKLLNPRVFAKVLLQAQTQFTSKYSLVLYEYLIDVLSRSKQKEGVITFELKELQDLLDSTLAYKFLNSNILRKATNEIDKFTNINVSYEGVKVGRRIEKVTFNIKLKNAVQQNLPLNLPDEENPFSDDQIIYIEKLIKYGISRAYALKTVQEFSIDRIEGNILIVDQARESGKVKNLPAYLMKAIKEDYRPQEAQIEKEAREVREQGDKQRRIAAEQKKAQKDLEQEWVAYIERTIRDKYYALPGKHQAKLLDEFASSDRMNSIIRKPFQKEGLKSPMVQAVFFTGLKEYLLTEPQETDLHAYAQWKETQQVTLENA